MAVPRFSNERYRNVTALVSSVVLGVCLFLYGCSYTDATKRHADKLSNTTTTNAYASVTTNGSGAVASVNPIATQTGLDILNNGGNAIDAAVAVAMALGVVDSHNSGIGGGCFILAHLADGRILALDGREMAPAAAHRDMFLRDGKAVKSLSKTGALAIGVPGSVAALHSLQRQGGELSFSDVIQPSILLAERGFPVGHVFTARLASNQDALSQYPHSQKIFLPNDTLLNVGDTLIQKELAETYRQLAKQGPDYFYRGEFAKATARWMKNNGGLITEADFANYTLKERAPIMTSFGKGDYTLIGFPSPSSGGLHVAQILTMLEAQGVHLMTEAERYHYIIEASKLAFADRAYWMGDADFVDVPKGLLNISYLQQRASSISSERASTSVDKGLPPNYKTELFNRHTTHISTADKEGNWVAITTTLNTSFGSKVTIPGTGVLMNNQMDDFSIQPGVANAFGLVGAEANAVAAQKRPLSSMSPTLVLNKDKQPVMSLGAAGGPTIISQVSQTIFNHLILEKPLNKAMETVRVHHQWKPDRVFIDGYANDVLKKALTEKGHALHTWPAFGATQAISLQGDKFVAESEPRIQKQKK